MAEYELNKLKKLQEAIISVVAFFDLFDYPLTVFEIWNYLQKKEKISEINNVLEKSESFFEKKEGFFFLVGRSELVRYRQERYNFSCRKIKIASHFVRLFRLCPYVKAIYLANSIGAHNLRDGSDIDFFIIAASGRIWLSRLYCTGLAKILNSRPTPKNKRDKICLSFYTSEDYLNLNDLKLGGNDPYFDYWRQSLFLLYNKDKTDERFSRANSAEYQDLGIRYNGTLAAQSCLEKIAKKIQLLIMPRALLEAKENSDGVVIADQVLKLYQRDRRREYAEKYANKINEIIAKNS